MAQQVKDPKLSLQWLKLLLWQGFDPWLRNFHMPWVPEKKKKKKLGLSIFLLTFECKRSYFLRTHLVQVCLGWWIKKEDRSFRKKYTYKLILA